MFRRIVVVGTSGAGKSTLAKELSQKLELPYIELDALFWKENWVPCEKDVFQSKIKEVVQKDSWVVDGNYGSASEIIWSRATDLVWLDYPLYLPLYRALKRSFQRIKSNEKICGNNYESYQRLFSKESILVWIIKSHWRRKRGFCRYLQQTEHQHLKVFHFKSPKETSEFVNG